MTADKKTCSAAYGARPGLSRGKVAGRNVYTSARLTCISPPDLYIQVFGTNAGKSEGLVCVGGKGMQEERQPGCVMLESGLLNTGRYKTIIITFSGRT